MPSLQADRPTRQRLRRIHRYRLLARWRLWWNAGTGVFGLCLSAVLVAEYVPRIVRRAIPGGFVLSVVLFFVGFCCLARRQARPAEE